MSMGQAVVTTTVLRPSGSKRLIAGLLALVIGVLLLGVVGFTHLAVVHNVAHDGRHSFAFPCH